MKNINLENITSILLSSLPWLVGIGAVIGLVVIEYIYFSSADNVRLLFVILLAPVGAFLGAGAVALAIYGLIALAFWAVLALGLAAVVGVIYLFYSIIVWSN